MLSSITIKSLYPLALAEGEGVGTAYEYYAKRLVLAPLLAQSAPPKRILVAGLPEEYGSSLDFLLLGSETGAEVVVVDERPAALEKARRSLATAQEMGALQSVDPDYRLVGRGELALAGHFNLALSCEVLQRLPVDGRRVYCEHLYGAASTVALFAPNADNPAHTELSGLDGLFLFEMRTLLGDAPQSSVGYIDMPPFHPGVTRSDEQRQQATSGWMEAAAMWGLGFYARAERFFPAALRRKQSHIVYGTAVRPKR